MKRDSKIKNLIKKILILIILIYVSYIFLCQQRSLNSYAAGQEYYSNQIEEQKQHQETLTALKENINSPEYIEEIARQKLDMYLPNERVYIDIKN